MACPPPTLHGGKVSPRLKGIVLPAWLWHRYTPLTEQVCPVRPCVSVADMVIMNLLCGCRASWYQPPGTSPAVYRNRARLPAKGSAWPVFFPIALPPPLSREPVANRTALVISCSYSVSGAVRSTSSPGPVITFAPKRLSVVVSNPSSPMTCLLLITAEPLLA